MSKISITLDVSKINKAKIVDRKYTNKAGVEVVQKQYKIEVVPTKEVKVIAQGDTWVMKKTHFVVEAQTKEERAGKAPSVYVGEGFTFEEKGNGVLNAPVQKQSSLDNFDTIEYPDEDINVDDIPF